MVLEALEARIFSCLRRKRSISQNFAAVLNLQGFAALPPFFFTTLALTCCGEKAERNGEGRAGVDKAAPDGVGVLLFGGAFSD